MKISLAIISLLFLVSCKQDKIKQPSFYSIDISYGNGWTKYVSVHVDSCKTINIRIDELNNGINYYRDKLSDSTFYLINKLIDSVIKIDYDSVIGNPVPDGGSYSVVLKSKAKTINTLNYLHSNCCKSLDSLIFKLVELGEYIKTPSNDTTFKFESYMKVAPPLLETVKFVPPVINDDEDSH